LHKKEGFMPDDKAADRARIEEHGIGADVVAPLVVAGGTVISVVGNRLAQPKPPPAASQSKDND
jgi:hypothetical protein